MLHFGRGTIASILLVTLFGLLFAIPNFFATDKRADLFPSFIGQGLTLGLDLQGGAHFVLAIDEETMKRDLHTALLENIHRLMRDRDLGKRTFLFR